MEPVSLITVIVPVLDEHESLAQLTLELLVTAEKNSLPIEILFVDDGSTDRSWDTIRQIAAGDARVRGIRFSGNFGKSAALVAGMRSARGSVIVELDADLQDVPGEIPRLLQKLGEGYDFVTGWGSNRHEPRHRSLSARILNRLVSRATGLNLHDHHSGFRCFRSDVVNRLGPQVAGNRLLAAFVHAHGCMVAELPVRRRPRRWGHSKCEQGRFRNALLDLFHLAFPPLKLRQADQYSILEQIPEKDAGI
jgi:glycosyltransferase involved in cell wall biosynthesis